MFQVDSSPALIFWISWARSVILACVSGARFSGLKCSFVRRDSWCWEMDSLCTIESLRNLKWRSGTQLSKGKGDMPERFEEIYLSLQWIRALSGTLRANVPPENCGLMMIAAELWVGFASELQLQIDLQKSAQQEQRVERTRIWSCLFLFLTLTLSLSHSIFWGALSIYLSFHFIFHSLTLSLFYFLPPSLSFFLSPSHSLYPSAASCASANNSRLWKGYCSYSVL